jgi:hypothetical protein
MEHFDFNVTNLKQKIFDEHGVRGYYVAGEWRDTNYIEHITLFKHYFDELMSRDLSSDINHNNYTWERISMDVKPYFEENAFSEIERRIIDADYQLSGDFPDYLEYIQPAEIREDLDYCLGAKEPMLYTEDLNKYKPVGAVYLPFHYFGYRSGIYFDCKKLSHLTEEIYDYCHKLSCKISREKAFLVAKYFSYFDAFYRHKLECFATRMEIATRKSFYINGFARFKKTQIEKGRLVYEDFLSREYAYRETREKLRRHIDSEVFDLLIKIVLPRSKKYIFDIYFTNTSENTFKETIVQHANYLNGDRFVPWDERNRNAFFWDVFTMSSFPYMHKASIIAYNGC